MTVHNDALQSEHWTHDQVTLLVNITLWWDKTHKRVIKHANIFVSDDPGHDSTNVQYCQRMHAVYYSEKGEGQVLCSLCAWQLLQPHTSLCVMPSRGDHSLVTFVQVIQSRDAPLWVLRTVSTKSGPIPTVRRRTSSSVTHFNRSQL